MKHHKLPLQIAVLVVCLLVTACQPEYDETDEPAVSTTRTPTRTPESTATEPFVPRTRTPDRTATTDAFMTVVAATLTQVAEIHAQNEAGTSTTVPTATAWAIATATGRADNAAAVWAEIQADSSAYPMAWPMQPFTEEQVAEVRGCEVRELYNERYSSITENADLPGAYPLKSACDWAVLAAAYDLLAEGTDPSGWGEPPVQLSDEAYRVFYHTLSLNPAFVLEYDMIRGYLTSARLVDAAPITEQPLQSAMLSYFYGTIGAQMSATIIITQANSSYPQVSGFIDASVEADTHTLESIRGTLDPALMTRMGRSLTNLIPIEKQFSTIGCTDYYPGWDMMLTYADGTVVSISTNGNNMLNGGGPWQVKIGEQNYLQFSYELSEIINEISEVLDFPFTESIGMDCGPLQWLDLGYK